MFIITIEAETAAEARAKLLDLARVIGGSAEPTQAAVAVVMTGDKNGAAIEWNIAGAPAPAPAPAEPPLEVDEPKLKPEELRAMIRATLAPVSETNPAAVKALISQYGGSVTKIPDDSLPVVLEAAKKLGAS